MQRSLAVIAAVLLMMALASCSKMSGTPNENPPMRANTITHPIA